MDIWRYALGFPIVLDGNHLTFLPSSPYFECQTLPRGRGFHAQSRDVAFPEM